MIHVLFSGFDPLLMHVLANVELFRLDSIERHSENARESLFIHRGRRRRGGRKIERTLEIAS